MQPTTSGPAAVVTFHSDGSGSGRGFTLAYNAKRSTLDLYLSSAFKRCFPPGYLVPPRFCLHLFQSRTFGDKWHRNYRPTGCMPFLSPNKQCQSTKENSTQSTDCNQERSPTSLMHSSFATMLFREEALFPLRYTLFPLRYTTLMSSFSALTLLVGSFDP